MSLPGRAVAQASGISAPEQIRLGLQKIGQATVQVIELSAYRKALDIPRLVNAHQQHNQYCKSCRKRYDPTFR